MHFLFEPTNRALFLAINAPADLSGLSFAFAVFASNYCVALLAAVLLWSWMRSNSAERQWLMMVGIACLLALSLNAVIAMLLPHPRPFMVPIGHTLILHDPDNSFPSDHATLMWTFAFGLCWQPRLRRIGFLAVLLATLTSWGRIFLGVHFPFDILGSILVAAAALAVSRPFQPWVSKWLAPSVERVHANTLGKWFRQSKAEN